MKKLIQDERHRLPLFASLCFSSLVSIILIFMRVYWSARLTYFFLIWNLFLAWIPFLLSQTIDILDRSRTPKRLHVVLFFIWLVFFPNCPYIITDFFHFGQKHAVPIWFDLVLIFSFVWNGLILGYISLLDVHRFFERRFKRSLSWLIVILILFLSSFGVYLGRYERWNSWDIIRNPIALLADIADRMLHPFSHPRTIGVTVLFSLFLVTSYITLVLFFKYLSSKDNKS